MTVEALKVEDVCVSYGSKYVLDRCGFTVQKGEIFGLIGLNGAGKTTLIKSILGLREHNSGNIYINGSIRANGGVDNFSYLPEKFEPSWFLTGYEFIKFSLKLYGLRIDNSEIEKYAASVALDKDALKRRMNTYSKGMRQKLGLLGTLLTKSHLMILDEPMSGLDPRARHLVKKMICDMRSQEMTIFLSSHILADMDEICDRVAILNKGKITFVGTPDELKKKTANNNLETAFLTYIEE